MVINKTVVIISVTSSVGNFLARKYLLRGWKVIGTYRNHKHLGDLVNQGECTLVKCDVTKKKDVARFIKQLTVKRIKWQRFISCVGNLLPADKFSKCNFDQWQESVEINALGQLRVLHALYPLKANAARVVFFAGGGVNNAVADITAYTASKMMLTKMVEFLDLEEQDMSLMIVGPGWTKTKIHDAILKSANVSKAKRSQTQQDLDNKPSTSLEDIDECIDYLCSLPKKTVSGRNFSVVHDPWRVKNRKKLEQALTKDINLYKLRRFEKY